MYITASTYGGIGIIQHSRRRIEPGGSCLAAVILTAESNLFGRRLAGYTFRQLAWGYGFLLRFGKSPTPVVQETRRMRNHSTG